MHASVSPLIVATGKECMPVLGLLLWLLVRVHASVSPLIVATGRECMPVLVLLLWLLVESACQC